MEYEIVHNFQENRFEAISDNKVIGLIDYSPTKDGKVIIATHTEISTEYEGKGIAGSITKAFLDYLQQEKLRVLPICSYTKGYIDRHPEYHNLLDK